MKRVDKKWKDRSRRRQKSQSSANRRRNRYDIEHHRWASHKRHSPRENVTVVAPTVFSFVNNTNGMVEFLNQMWISLRKTDLLIDLSGVTSLTSDAMAVMLSHANSRRFSRKRTVGGNEPLDPDLRKMIVETGFYDHVRRLSGYTVELRKGKTFRRKRGKKVEVATIEEIIDFSSQLLYGTRVKMQGLYRVLVECMANTKDHAWNNKENPESWWVTMYFDSNRQTLCFTFVDAGMGIMQSLDVRRFKHIIAAAASLTSDSEILKEIVERKHGSRTGFPYRGKGLPAIYKAWQRKQIERLIILTNNAVADFSASIFRTLPHTFRGTLLYWEITAAPKQTV